MPRKFNEESRGLGIVALNSQTYCFVKDQPDLHRDFLEPPGKASAERATRLAKRVACTQKYSSKGLNKRIDSLGFVDCMGTLETGGAIYGNNMGFVKKNNVLYMYSQTK